MSFLTFAEIYGSVQNLSPNQISATVAKARANEAYRDILRLRAWLGLQVTDTFYNPLDKNTGTISLTEGSAAVVGIDTSLDSGDVGRYLEVGQRVPIRIASVTDSLNFTLEQSWGEPNLSTSPYIIKTLRYNLPTDAERIIRITGPDWPLVRRSPALIDYFDPKRIWRGDPMVFCEIEITTSGAKEIEIWPIPSEATTYARQYRKVAAPLVNDNDLPLIDGEAIRAKARAMQCEIMLARTGDPIWDKLADRYGNQEKELLDAMIREDRRQRGSHPGLLDNEMPDPAWVRAWSSLGLGEISGFPSGYGTGGFGVGHP